MKIMMKTHRITLREFIAEDDHFIYELLNTDDWKKNIGDRGIHTLDDARGYIINKLQKGYAENGFGMYAVCLLDETIIGMCGLVKRTEFEYPDIGFAFLPSYYGQGYAIESAQAVLHYAIEDLKKENLYAICIPSNERSIHLIKKLGLKYKKNILPDGDKEELELYCWK